MTIVGLLAGLATMLLGLVLGVRLLRLAARTRQAPELAMGLYCLLVTLGSALLWVAYGGALESGSPAAVAIAAASTFSIGAGAFALAVGVARIFHPGERAARVAVGLVGLGLLASWIATVAPGRPVTLADATIANALFVGGRAAVYLVGAAEALRHFGKLRRRAALGLADPVSTQQILLWGLAWLSVAAIALGSLAVGALAPGTIFEYPAAGLVVNALNLAAWGCTWFAFFPPAFYQRRVEARYAEAGA